MLRALGDGFMPSNEQVVVNLRAFLSSDFLNPDTSGLSDSARLLVKHIKQCLFAFIDTLQNKNAADEVQDLLWCLAKSRISVDTGDLAARASAAKSKANTAAAYQSVRTVGTLLLQNSDFRLFLGDLQTVGREVFQDSALTASKVAEEAGHKVGPNGVPADETAVAKTDAENAPSKQELAGEVKDVTQALKHGVAEIGESAIHSTAEHLSGDEKRVLMQRLQAAVTNLRQRPNYTDSVSTLATLLQRYALVYSRMLTDTLDTIENDTHENREVDESIKNFGALLKKFGDPLEWEVLQQKFERVLEHSQSSSDFEHLVNEISNAVSRMLADPTFYEGDNPRKELQRIRDEGQRTDRGIPLSEDVDHLLKQIQKTAHSVYQDEDITKLLAISHNIMQDISPKGAAVNKHLLHDALNVFIPLLINAVQYLPVPRLEVAIPELDLLLENLILQPGGTVNHSSFLPFRFRVESYNKIEIRKTLTSTVSSTASLFTIKIDGLSARADGLGYWMKMHKGLLNFEDEGLASFHLDERGIDIHIDVEVGKDRLESILSLKAVRVKIHHLHYQLKRSKFSLLATLARPIVRPIIRKTLERQLASGIADFFHAANRELVFARERLRATRVADPNDLMTFVKAVAARLQPADNPDVYVRMGLNQPGKGTFKGKYAPGSLAKLWELEGRRAGERVDDFERGGWRNAIFDLKATATSQGEEV